MCGQAEVDGDFIVPIAAAHLDGALNLDITGAFHSPLGSKISFLGPWYGSEEVRRDVACGSWDFQATFVFCLLQFLQQWIEHLGVESAIMEPSIA